MNLEEFNNNMKRDFAFYGFVSCPLTDDEIAQLYAAGLTFKDAYSVGCDVAAGHDFYIPAPSEQ